LHERSDGRVSWIQQHIFSVFGAAADSVLECIGKHQLLHFVPWLMYRSKYKAYPFGGHSLHHAFPALGQFLEDRARRLAQGHKQGSPRRHTRIIAQLTGTPGAGQSIHNGFAWLARQYVISTGVCCSLARCSFGLAAGKHRCLGTIVVYMLPGLFPRSGLRRRLVWGAKCDGGRFHGSQRGISIAIVVIVIVAVAVSTVTMKPSICALSRVPTSITMQSTNWVSSRWC